MDKKFNFEYCVKRAEVLTEMARPTNLFGMMERELNSAYDFLRKHITQRTMDKAGVTTEKAIRMMIEYVKDSVDLSKDEIQAVEKTTKGGLQMGQMKMLLDKVVKDGRLDKQGLIDYITNEENIDDYLNFNITNQGSRAKGREKEVQQQTDLTREELAELSRRMVPYARQIGKMMKQKTGLYDDDMGDEEEFNDKVLYADYVVDAIQKFLIKKNSLKENDPYSNSKEKSLFASRGEDNTIYSSVTPRDINMFLNLFQKKVDSGEGETSEGFSTLIEKLKAKGLPEKQLEFVNLIKQTADQDYKNFVEDMRDTNAQIAGLPYYDGEIVRRVIQNPEDLQDFVLWNTAKDRLELNRAYKQGSSFKFDLPKEEEPMGESFDICGQILCEQKKRDRFQTEIPKFSERKFRKAPNAYYWLEENKRLFGE